MNLKLFLLVLIPLASGPLLFSLRSFFRLEKILALSSHALQLILSIFLLVEIQQAGIQTLRLGDWPAPYGIVLVGDTLSLLLLVASQLIALCSLLASWQETISHKEKKSGYHALVQLLMAGVAWSFLTGDLFNLFVGFEIMLMSSFVLMTLDGSRPRLKAGIEYVTLNLISSMLFLSGLGLLYAHMGSLNIADLSVKISQTSNLEVLLFPALLLSLAFGIKAAVFPLFFWLPDAYSTLPSPLLALFGGVLTKVGIYALVRVWTMVFAPLFPQIQPYLFVLANFTMVVGVLGAVAQYQTKRLLSFHIVSQIGYMVLGLALFQTGAIAATIFFVLHNMFAKSNLFLIAGAIEKISGSRNLKKSGDLLKYYPSLAVLFLISGLALAGVPPLSGFFAKYFLIRQALTEKAFWSVGIALAVSLMTLFSMMKIWNEAFWKGRAESHANLTPHRIPLTWNRLLPIYILSGMVLALGLGAGFFWNMTERAALDLKQPQPYIEAVLGGQIP